MSGKRGLREPKHQDWSSGRPVHTEVHRDDTLTLSGADYMRDRHRLMVYEFALHRIAHPMVRCDGSPVAETVEEFRAIAKEALDDC